MNIPLGNPPSLYGIVRTNRTNDELWTKNNFNSAFPVSLACYMRDNGMNPVYLHVNNALSVQIGETSFDNVFGTTLPNEEINFDFESQFTPYQRFAHDTLQRIDLVTKHGDTFLRPLEIKLTVLPDSSTYRREPRLWGSELVVRPITTSYAALDIADSLERHFPRIREIIEPSCRPIRYWNSSIEVSSQLNAILDALNMIQREFHTSQRPFLLQPIWKTQGIQPTLDENAFDIFVWSNFALLRTFLDKAQNERGVTRYTRSAVRLARILYELSTRGSANIQEIYREMSYDLQTDKEFALNGQTTNSYMVSPQLLVPRLRREVLRDIILHGGEGMLRPERRFDQTVFFTSQVIFQPDET